MRNLIFSSLFLLSLGFSGVVNAANLLAPYDIDNTAVLPKKIRSPRFKDVFLQMEDKFNGIGNQEGLGANLNKQLTFGTLVEAQATAKDKALAEGTILASGLNLSDSPGATTGQVNTFVDVKIPVLAYGLTEKTTLALAVPIYNIQVKADTGFVATPQAQMWAQSVCQASPEKCNGIKTQLADPVNLKLQKMGYQPIRSGEVKGIGDLKFVSKTQVYNSQANVVAIKGSVTLPTGVSPDVDKVVDTPTGDGQWDVGARLLWDQKYSPDIMLTTYSGVNFQLPDQMARRIPQQAGDPLSPDKEIVYRDLGDQLEAGITALAGSPSGGMSVSFGYSYQYMTPTRFHGTQYAPERYHFLESLNPDQELHALTLGVAYSTIDHFKAGEFVLPLQTNFVVSHPLAGRNVVANDIYAAELVLFF